MKTCSKCGETKPLEDFHKNKRQKDGYQDRCKECVRNYTQRYGGGLYTRAAKDSLFELQGKQCAVCGIDGTQIKSWSKHTPFHLDHNHNTGAARGVLCWRCNIALGMVGESVEILRALIRYLKKHAPPIQNPKS